MSWKLAKYTPILYCIRKYCTTEALKLIYNCLVYYNLIYCNSVRVIARMMLYILWRSKKRAWHSCIFGDQFSHSVKYRNVGIPHTSIALWIKYPLRRTSEDIHEYNYLNVSFFYWKKSVFSYFESLRKNKKKLVVVWYILIWFFRCSHWNLQNHWILEAFRKKLQKQPKMFHFFNK